MITNKETRDVMVEQNKEAIRKAKEGLKTLKDLGLGYMYEKDIKEEAIKWVKDMHSKGIYGFSKPFIEFHNISEEDLK